MNNDRYPFTREPHATLDEVNFTTEVSLDFYVVSPPQFDVAVGQALNDALNIVFNEEQLFILGIELRVTHPCLLLDFLGTVHVMCFSRLSSLNWVFFALPAE